MSMVRWVQGFVILAAMAGTMATETATAAEALQIPGLRTRFLILRRGSQEVVNFGTLNDTVTSNRYIVLLLGTGTGQLTVSDADASGDTINVTGELRSVFPVTFSESATSPEEVEIGLLVTRFGILTFDVQYSAMVNAPPSNYFYRLRF